jgi:hypothetical protein
MPTAIGPQDVPLDTVEHRDTIPDSADLNELIYLADARPKPILILDFTVKDEPRGLLPIKVMPAKHNDAA